MGELELVGLHDDGEHLVLAGVDGQRFRLRIDEPLRAAVRRDRPQLAQLKAEQAGALSPREIQARIRSGMSAAELVETMGLSLEQVRRYEGPVLAEREFIAEQARATRVGRDAGAPELGDLVTDRLATRGVDPATLAWDAYRANGGPWTVVVRFEIGSGEHRAMHEARWTYDTQTRTAEALEDEARWLSETELPDEPLPRRHLAAVRGEGLEVGVDSALRPVLAAVDGAETFALRAGWNGAEGGGESGAERWNGRASEREQEETAALLDDLRGRRGVRQPLELPGEDDLDDDLEPFGPPHAFGFASDRDDAPRTPGRGFDIDMPRYDVPAAHPPVSDRTASVTALARRTGEAELGLDTPPAVPTEPVTDAVPAPARPAAEPTPTTPGDGIGRRGRRGRASVPSWDEIVFGAKPE